MARSRKKRRQRIADPLEGNMLTPTNEQHAELAAALKPLREGHEDWYQRMLGSDILGHTWAITTDRQHRLFANKCSSWTNRNARPTDLALVDALYNEKLISVVDRGWTSDDEGAPATEPQRRSSELERPVLNTPDQHQEPHDEQPVHLPLQPFYEAAAQHRPQYHSYSFPPPEQHHEHHPPQYQMLASHNHTTPTYSGWTGVPLSPVRRPNPSMRQPPQARRERSRGGSAVPGTGAYRVPLHGDLQEHDRHDQAPFHPQAYEDTPVPAAPAGWYPGLGSEEDSRRSHLHEHIWK